MVRREGDDRVVASSFTGPTGNDLVVPSSLAEGESCAVRTCVNSRDAPHATHVRLLAGEEDAADARRLVREFASSLPISLDFQDFETELANLGAGEADAHYREAVGGAFLIARDAASGVALGVVGVHRHSYGDLYRGCAEMKRLYVSPVARGRGVGQLLVEAIMDVSRHLGYGEMVLDTLELLEAANVIYTRNGFAEIPAYYDNPSPGVKYYKRAL